MDFTLQILEVSCNYTVGYENIYEEDKTPLVPKSTVIVRSGEEKYELVGLFVLTEKELEKEYLFPYDSITFYAKLTEVEKEEVLSILGLTGGKLTLESSLLEKLVLLQEFFMVGVLDLRKDINQTLNCLSHFSKKLSLCRNEHVSQFYFFPCFQNTISKQTLSFEKVYEYFSKRQKSLCKLKTLSETLRRSKHCSSIKFEQKPVIQKLKVFDCYYSGVLIKEVPQICGELYYDLLQDRVFRLDNFFWDHDVFVEECQAWGLIEAEEEPLLQNTRTLFDKDYEEGEEEKIGEPDGFEEMDLISSEEEEEEQQQAENVVCLNNIKINPQQLTKALTRLRDREEESYHFPSFSFPIGFSSDLSELLINLLHVIKFYQFCNCSQLIEQKVAHPFSNKALLLQSLCHKSFYRESLHVQIDHFHAKRRALGLPYQGFNLKLNKERKNEFKHYVVPAELQTLYKKNTQNNLALLGVPVLQHVFVSTLFFAFPDADENEITLLKNDFLSKESLAKIFLALGLLDCAMFGSKSFTSGVMNKEKIHANVVLAVFGAIFLDNKKFTNLRLLLTKMVFANCEWTGNKLLLAQKLFLGKKRFYKKKFQNQFLSKNGLYTVSCVENRIGIVFSNKAILLRAITHSSLKSSSNCRENYERLEILGDSVLELLVIWKLYEESEHISEGMLQAKKISLVQNKNLYDIMNKLGLCSSLRKLNLKDNKAQNFGMKIYADVFEAIVGAIFVDSDLATCLSFVEKVLLTYNKSEMKIAAQRVLMRSENPKSKLQELSTMLINKKLIDNPLEFRIISEDASNSKERFLVGVFYQDILYGSAKARTKTEAEMNAAVIAIETIRETFVF